MKHIRSIIASLAATVVLPLFSSCEGDHAEPPIPMPEGLFTEIETPDGPEKVIGKGTWEIPLTCYQARIGTKPAGMTDNVWVSGYIVGWISSDISATLKQESGLFTSAASVKSNVLLSDFTPEELVSKFVEKDEDGNIISDTRWKHAVPVQLVYDTDPRPALNLADNPGNYGKRVSVMGETHLMYFGVYAVKFTSAYNWGSQGYYIAPPEPGTFKLTTEFEGDKWYLIEYDKTIAKTFNSSRSFISTTSANINGDNTIKLKDMWTNAFYFENAMMVGGPCVYRIRMNNGLYLCTDGTDKAFHTTDNPDQNICLFTVTPQEDGTFQIKANNGTQMMYDSGYGSYGLYSTITSDHHRPSLYVLVEK